MRSGGDFACPVGAPAPSVQRMPSELESVSFDAHDAALLAQFWAALLNRNVVHDGADELLLGGDSQLGLRFTASNAVRVGRDRVHLHLTSTAPGDQQRLVQTALGLGASPLDVGQLPEEGHVVLADPEGNEFCVIEPGNGFLAGCGLLGELACDGTRDVGLFWSQALCWPLVWDQSEETAIQSPNGGTKVAWGGPPLAPRTGSSRQRLQLVLVGGDHQLEIDRLVSLGATPVENLTLQRGFVALADPDGNEFRLTFRDRERQR